MSAFDRLSRMCGPQVPPELLAELAAHRAEVLNEAVEAARAEHLKEDTGTPEDEAYNEGVDDAVAAIGALLASPAAAPVPVKTAGDETGEGLSPEREAEIRAARYTNRTTSPAAADIAIDDLLDELDRLRGERDELTARARRVAVSHEHFIQDHDDPGTEALAAQYELINHLSRSADPGDLPLNPVETALRVVLAVLDETQDDASPREIRGAIAEALPRDDKSDHRHRIYIDGRGEAWMDVSVEADGTTHIAQVEKSFSVGTPMTEVAERTGSLREIGRCW